MNKIVDLIALILLAFTTSVQAQSGEVSKG